MEHAIDPIAVVAELLARKSMPHERLNVESDALDRYARCRWHQVLRSREWNVASKHSDQWRALQQIPEAQCPAEDEFLLSYPRLRSHVRLVEQCLSHYPAVLCGRMSALEVLFPNGDASLLKNWYADTPTLRMLNVHLADAIVGYAVSTGNSALRILELGAGTAATTRVILPMIADYIDEYCFTDLSDAFLQSASAEFSAYSFMRYQKLDAMHVAKLARGYDIIIAANVLHAVSPLGEALQRISAALADNGLLLLNETINKHDVLTIAFGILDGWWHTNDGTVERMPDSPLLSVQGWRRALLKYGFDRVTMHGNESFKLLAACPRGELVERIPAVCPASAGGGDQPQTAQAIEGRLCDIVGAVILLDPVDLDRQTPLLDYGVDSILALKIVEQISNMFGAQPADLLERHPSIRSLAGYLSTPVAMTESVPDVIPENPRGSPFASLRRDTVASADDRDCVASAPRGRTQTVADRLCDIVGAVILLDSADLDRLTPLLDYGVDSILALKITEQISNEFGAQPSDLLTHCPTISALANRLSRSAPPAPAEPSQPVAIFESPAETAMLPVGRIAPARRDEVKAQASQVIADRLCALVGAVILLDPGDLERQTPLIDYGVDSILALKIVEQISNEFGPQPSDLLERHPSVHALAAHLSAADVPANATQAISTLDHATAERHPDVPASLAPMVTSPATSGISTATRDEEEVPDLIAHHVVGGRSIAPGAYALSWVTEASGARRLSNVRWHLPMVRLKDARLDHQDGRFRIVDQRSGHTLCSGEYDPAPDAPPPPLVPRLANAQVLDQARIYRRFESLGYAYGPLYRGISLAGLGKDSCIGILACPRECERQLPPALIDAGLQTSILLSDMPGGNTSWQMLPSHLSRLNLYALPDPGEVVMCMATIAGRHENGARFDYQYARMSGEILFTLTGMLAVGGASSAAGAPTLAEEVA